jgi:hypothetical protein
LGFRVGFDFLEYAVRSAPSVTIPQLSAVFGTTALNSSFFLESRRDDLWSKNYFRGKTKVESLT